jgi:hypothetical protein
MICNSYKCLIPRMYCLILRSPQFLVGSVLPIILVFCVVFWFVIVRCLVSDVAVVSELSIRECFFGFL